MNLQKKILITFITLLAVPVITLALLSGIQIVFLSDANANDSSDALIDDNLANLELMTTDEAILIDETFQQFNNEIRMLDSYTEDLFNEKINITPGLTYYWDKVAEFAESGRTIPGLKTDENYGIEVSFDTSCYYLPREQMRGNNDPFDLSPYMEKVLNYSSNMDNMFQSLHEANSNYIWIYAGFEGEGHLFKNYPYAEMSWCLDYEYYEGTVYQGRDYDPHIEEWYKNAVAITDNSTAFTSPYYDPDVGLIISIGRPVHFSNGTRFGVVSADITITAINNNILGLKVSDNGYAFMLDRNGNVISHPDLDQEAEEPESITDLEFGQVTSEKTAFQSIVNGMSSGKSDTKVFTKGGKKWYISYVPINTTGYSLGIVVPESDIISSAVNIKNTILGLTGIQTIIFALILIVVIFGVLVVGSVISNKVVQPVRELTTMVNFIAEGDLSRDLRGNAASMGKEVATLHSAFDNLLTSLRFGNTDYYRGDYRRAYQNYKKALELFTTTKNERGVAIATNNLGNIYRAWNDYEKARSSYMEAIRIGELQGDKKGLASRTNNLGLLYLDQKDYDSALRMLNLAKTYDEEINNIKGLITRIGNIGIVYEKLENFSEAERCFEDAIKLAEKNNDTRGLANSYIKYAVFHMIRNHFKEAQNYLEKSLELAKSIDDVPLALNCLDRLATVYEELDKTTESHKARINAENIRKKIINPKMVLFVLDQSGSMQGSKNRSVLRGAKKLFIDQINPQDKVGIVVFHSSSAKILPLTEVEGNEKLIEKKISQLKYPSGTTAFYDALGDALIFLNKERGNEQKWVIALTDGEDNASMRFDIIRHGRSSFLNKFISDFRRTSIPDFIDENLLTVNLVVVGVGREVRAIEHLIRPICDATPRGRYIDVSSPQTKIENAIDDAFEEIREVMGEVDVEGFDISES